MKTKTFFYFSCVLTCLAIIVSCQKTDLGQPASANDVYSGSLGAFFAEELANMTESGTIDASAGGQITLSDGTVVTIPAGSFSDANGTVGGDVDLSVGLISGNADMALANLQSVTSSGQMLVSGGVVNIEAGASGSGDLSLNNPINVSVPNTFENNSTPGAPGSITTNEGDMTIFTGVEQQDGSILWEEDNQSTFQYNQQTNSYDFSTSSIGFINCDAFVTDPMNCGADTDVPVDGIGNESCYTDVTFTCPNGFDSGSMQVWIYFDNLSSLLGVPYNAGDNTFEISNVLGGQEVHFVVLAEKNGAFYTLPTDLQGTALNADNSSTPGGHGIVSIPEHVLVETTTDEWKEMLNQLP